MRHIARLDRENNETLYAYAQFLGEPTDYVLNQLIDSVLAKDKEFVAWRSEHPESFVPQPEPSAQAQETAGTRARDRATACVSDDRGVRACRRVRHSGERGRHACVERSSTRAG